MKLPNSYYNSTSFFGTLIAGFSIIVLLFLFILTRFFYDGGPYMGVIFYMITPVFLVFGLLLIPLGMWRKRRKEKRTQQEDTQWKVIDMNDVKTRNAMIIFFVGTFVFILISSVGSYQAFHFTESNEFCGTLCHEVMSPEYTAYQESSHARVRCVECHVGEGAGWYMRSKLSGVRQVIGVMTGDFHRPIETPLANLRPARETCEKCHWPNKFYSHRLVNERSYLADSANTAWNVTLKMKTGASHSANKLQEGIHWHINPNVQIEYIALSNEKESIPWVIYRNLETGDSIIFQDEMNPLTPEALDTLVVRTMDCMDCHNRPSHNYNSPTDYVDDGFNKGTIPQNLPYIKQIAMGVLAARYSTLDSSLTYINDEITRTYKEDYPAVYASSQDLVEKAITGIQEEFKKNAFPEMKVYHNMYTNHIGHQESPGCFRCHSGTHMSDDGQTISKDCNLCHSILSQGPDVDTLMQLSPVNGSLTFKHPEDIDGAETEMHCSECHSALY